MVKTKEPIIWETPEYVYRERSTDWYWAVGIIAISISITSILFNNILFAIFIALSFFTLMLYTKRTPHTLQIKIDDRGIQVGRVKYPYSSLESFWVEDRFGDDKIIMKSKKLTMPYIVITIEDTEVDEVRNRLKKFLTEEEHTEPLARRIMEYLGF